jgi:serine/threonine-protein kinase
VKLADFGIARAMGQAGITAPGTLKGKLAYMAPEQARGEAVDARADVFALGIVLWELCAGRRLFARDSDAATLGAVLGEATVSPPSAWNDEVPPQLDRAILAALERDLARRTPSAEELAHALAGVLLRITRSPEDVDLRAFMHRLWPEGPAPAAAPERTRVRPMPVAAEPIAGATRASAPVAAALEAEASARAGSEESATRTAAPVASVRARHAILAGIAVALAGGLGVGAVVMRGRATANRTPTSTSTSTSNPNPNPNPNPTGTATGSPVTGHRA